MSVIVSIVVVLSAIFFILETEVPNPSNNATLVVEVGVGLIIAFFVYRTSKKTEKNNQDLLSNIRNTVTNLEYDTKRKILESKIIIKNAFVEIDSDLCIMLKEFEVHKKNYEDGFLLIEKKPKDVKHVKMLMAMIRIKKYSEKHLDNENLINLEIFPGRDFTHIDSARNTLQDLFSNFSDDEYLVTYLSLKESHSQIQTQISKLDEKIKIETDKISKLVSTMKESS